MALDKWIAVLFLVIAIVYGYASFTYPLLPFERNMAFLPNTLPMALSVFGVVLSLVVILSPKPQADADGKVLGTVDLDELRKFKLGQAFSLIAAMVIYAVALRPIGFIAATTAFLVGAGWILGERKLQLMIPIAIAAALLIWFLVQQALGIFLRPLPWFLT